MRTLLESADLIIFTLGLTEAWIHRTSGTVFPTAPGTLAGSFDPAVHRFHNFGFREIHDDFLEFRSLLSCKREGRNPRFLLTVSPVPLTATASGSHVMQATVYSKSVLRAVAGQLAADHEDIDYFPSYEIIANPWSDTCYYEANLRSVTGHGVNEVMRTFLAAHAGDDAGILKIPAQHDRKNPAESADDDLICEEVLLDAFRKKDST